MRIVQYLTYGDSRIDDRNDFIFIINTQDRVQTYMWNDSLYKHTNQDNYPVRCTTGWVYNLNKTGE